MNKNIRFAILQLALLGLWCVIGFFIGLPILFFLGGILYLHLYIGDFAIVLLTTVIILTIPAYFTNNYFVRRWELTRKHLLIGTLISFLAIPILYLIMALRFYGN